MYSVWVCICLGARLSGLSSTCLEHPIAPEWSAGPCFLALKHRRRVGRHVSPIAETYRTHLERGPGMHSLMQFAWPVIPIPSYQHVERQLGHVVVQPLKYSFVIWSNG